MEISGDYVTAAAIAANMASSAPPGVAPTSEKGLGTRFARDDHTHRSSVQTKRMTVSALTGGWALVTWTYDAAFADGVVPTVLATAENMASVGGTPQPLVVNLYGAPTNTQAQFIVFKGQATTLGGTLGALVGALINPFVSAPVNTVINCWAHV